MKSGLIILFVVLSGFNQPVLYYFIVKILVA